MASLFLTPEVAQMAVEIALPSIEKLMETLAKRKHLHIAVLDPTIKPWNGTFEDAMLHQHRIGHPVEWEHDYQSIAIDKTSQTWRTQMPNGLMHHFAASLLEHGDVKYESAYMCPISGQIVGCSGIQPYFDYLIGGWIAIACNQLAKHYSEIARQDEGDTFV